MCSSPSGSSINQKDLNPRVAREGTLNVLLPFRVVDQSERPKPSRWFGENLLSIMSESVGTWGGTIHLFPKKPTYKGVWVLRNIAALSRHYSFSPKFYPFKYQFTLSVNFLSHPQL
jgi:hypothetical protein